MNVFLCGDVSVVLDHVTGVEVAQVDSMARLFNVTVHTIGGGEQVVVRRQNEVLARMTRDGIVAALDELPPPRVHRYWLAEP